MIPQTQFCAICSSRSLAQAVIRWLDSFDPAEQSRLFHQFRDEAAAYRREMERGQQMGFVQTENGDTHCRRTEGAE